MRIVLVDDHKIMRNGIKSLLKDQSQLEVVGEAADGREASKLVRDTKPDLVIMDITMAGLNGIEATRQMTSDMPGLAVIALSMHRDARYVMGMLDAGAKGYVLKDSDFDELIQAIMTIAEGHTYLSPSISDALVENLVPNRNYTGQRRPGETLSPREREVIQLLVEGYNNHDIADTLCVSVKTVETHRYNIMKKLELRSLAELTKFALREGITSLEE
jgi:DNA-binding NarL/FixJ family response regulator